MKFRILTLTDNSNYGNRLQNYALSLLLSEFGEIQTIKLVLNCDSALKYYCEKYLHFRELRNNLSTLKRAGSRSWRKRKNNFQTFSKLPELKSKMILSAYKGLDGPALDDNIVVLGSDQIWHYTWFTRDDLKLLLGSFADSSQLISYSASIGLDAIENSFRPVFRDGWNRILSISVREDGAAKLINQIAGKDATVVLDPTLMITTEQWSRVFTNFVSKSDRYVLTYFLGSPSDGQRTFIRDYAQAHGLRVRCLNDVRDAETYVAGPAEFVELISKADFIFTDSYHACCFSILYNRPFKVFNRSGFEGKESMNSRMRTLFRLFELEDLMGDDSEVSHLDWERINSLLELHREESRMWLKSALAEVSRKERLSN